MIREVESRKEGMGSKPDRGHCCDPVYWNKQQDCHLWIKYYQVEQLILVAVWLQVNRVLGPPQRLYCAYDVAPFMNACSNDCVSTFSSEALGPKNG